MTTKSLLCHIILNNYNTRLYKEVLLQTSQEFNITFVYTDIHYHHYYYHNHHHTTTILLQQQHIKPFCLL